LDPVIPVLARRRASGNPVKVLQKRYGFLLEFIPVKTGTGMTNKVGILDFCGRGSGRPQKYLRSKKRWNL